jgi:hypothetical protein
MERVRCTIEISLSGGTNGFNSQHLGTYANKGQLTRGLRICTDRVTNILRSMTRGSQGGDVKFGYPGLHFLTRRVPSNNFGRLIYLSERGQTQIEYLAIM